MRQVPAAWPTMNEWPKAPDAGEPSVAQRVAFLEQHLRLASTSPPSAESWAWLSSVASAASVVSGNEAPGAEQPPAPAPDSVGAKAPEPPVAPLEADPYMQGDMATQCSPVASTAPAASGAGSAQHEQQQVSAPAACNVPSPSSIVNFGSAASVSARACPGSFAPRCSSPQDFAQVDARSQPAGAATGAGPAAAATGAKEFGQADADRQAAGGAAGVRHLPQQAAWPMPMRATAGTPQVYAMSAAAGSAVPENLCEDVELGECAFGRDVEGRHDGEEHAPERVYGGDGSAARLGTIVNTAANNVRCVLAGTGAAELLAIAARVGDTAPRPRFVPEKRSPPSDPRPSCSRPSEPTTRDNAWDNWAGSTHTVKQNKPPHWDSWSESSDEDTKPKPKQGPYVFETHNDTWSSCAYDARSRSGHSDVRDDRPRGGPAATVVSMAAPPDKDGIIKTKGGERLTIDLGGHLRNAEGLRCDYYGRPTKPRGAKGAKSSERRGWWRNDGWAKWHGTTPQWDQSAPAEVAAYWWGQERPYEAVAHANSGQPATHSWQGAAVPLTPPKAQPGPPPGLTCSIPEPPPGPPPGYTGPIRPSCAPPGPPPGPPPRGSMALEPQARAAPGATGPSSTFSHRG